MEVYEINNMMLKDYDSPIFLKYTVPNSEAVICYCCTERKQILQSFDDAMVLFQNGHGLYAANVVIFYSEKVNSASYAICYECYFKLSCLVMDYRHFHYQEEKLLNDSN